MRNHLTLLGLTLLAALLVAFAACGQGNDAESPEPAASPDSTETVAPDGSPIEFETMEKGGRSGTDEEEPHVFKIETQDDWVEFWSQHRSNVVPAPPLPAVDFTHDMVVVAVDQQQPSGGYRFEITGLDDSDQDLVVHVLREIPAPDCNVVAVTTRPFHTVVLAQSDLQPQLEITDITRDCS
jgi:hypothetical protein